MKKDVPDQNSSWPINKYVCSAEEWAYDNFEAVRKIWLAHDNMHRAKGKTYSSWINIWREEITSLLNEVVSENK